MAVDVDGEAALDLAVDNALDHFLGGKRCLEFFPGLGALGLLARQLGLAEAVLDGFQRNLHLVADAQGALTGGVR
jgi:16S rRNA G966 N2-methylase RsmD